MPPTPERENVMRKFPVAAAILGMLLSVPVDAAELKIDDLTVGRTVSNEQNQATVTAAKTFYQFWDTGDESALNAAIALTFTDRTLPPGRPQGPEGPAFAAKKFRSAVPDLRVEVKKMIVTGVCYGSYGVQRSFHRHLRHSEGPGAGDRLHRDRSAQGDLWADYGQLAH